MGDSYYGWSMSLQKNMLLSYRSFDGTYHEFYDGATDAELSFVIYTDIDETIVDLYQQEKEGAAGYTLIRQGRKTGADGVEYVETEVKGSAAYIYRRVATLGRHTYELHLSLPVSMSIAERTPYIELIESFMLSFAKDGSVEDLSDLDERGLRTYQSANLDISFKVPAGFSQHGYISKTNEVRFAKPNEDALLSYQIAAIVLSIQPGESLDAWASSDRALNQRYFNPKVVSFSSLQSMTVAGQSARYYTFTYHDTITYDVFFYDKDYGYNISIRLDKSQEGLIQEILDSFRYTQLDPEVEGYLAHENMEEFELQKTYTLGGGKYSFSAPISFTAIGTSTDEPTLSNLSFSAILASASGAKNGLTLSTFANAVHDYLKENIDGYSVIQSPQSMQTKTGISGYQSTARYTVGEVSLISKMFAFSMDDKFCQIQFVYPEDFDGALLGDVWQGVLDSLTKT